MIVMHEKVRRLSAYDVVVLKLACFRPRVHASGHQPVFLRESSQARVPDFGHYITQQHPDYS